jgi:hypothetical protein
MPIDAKAIHSAVEEIDTAFAGLKPPGDAKLLHPQCMDDLDVADFYDAQERQELTGEMLIQRYAAPSFFSAEAFQYYMPAYMIWSLENSDSIEFVVESTLSAFDPGEIGSDLRDFQISKFALFTPEQIRAIISFLEAFTNDPELGEIAANALSHYWDRSD